MSKVFTDKDTGYKSLMTSFKTRKGESAAFVGYLRSSGNHKPKPDEKTPAEPITMAALAAVMEYGTKNGRIPARPFFFTTLKRIGRELEKKTKKAALLVLGGRLDEKTAIMALAQWVKQQIAHTIASNIPPPNKPYTIAHKGGKDHTLIDTGQLQDTLDIEYRQGVKKK
jgi:hypothetical protein